MEYVPGTTLRDLLVRRGALTAGETLEVLEPLLDALSAAHRAGLVHRDVKPENVLITEDGRVKVADFGLARAASTSNSTATTGLLMGTAAYLSPELVSRGIADARSDVYAVGIMTFEMLTGRQPYLGEVPIQVAFQHVNAQVPAPSSIDPGLPRALDEIVTWATARDPDLRPRDAAELGALAAQIHDRLTDDELDRVPAAPPVPPPPTPAGQIGPTPTDASMATRVVPVVPGDPGSVPPTTDDDGVPDDEPRRSRRGPLVLTMLLTLALVLGGVGLYFTIGPGGYTTTPKVSGTREQANQILNAHDLKMKQLDEYNEQVPAGQVIKTDPAAGQRVRKNGTVKVFISKGSKFTATDDLTGKTLDEARTVLAANDLVLGDTTEQAYSETVAEGSVVSQTPEPGATIERGQSVSVVTSKGREPIPVPGVTGKDEAAATAAIEDAGLVAAVKGDYSETVAAGIVLKQSPADGTLYRGDSVTITVSQGPPLVTVPPVINLKTEAATAALSQAGFQVKVEKVLGGGLGVVRAQNPAGGSQAPKGSVVTIQVV
jgi:serine/threonine-protein kinase